MLLPLNLIYFKAKSGLTIRQTTLIAYRDEVIFKTHFEGKTHSHKYL
jgi:hypothetical protein